AGVGVARLEALQGPLPRAGANADRRLERQACGRAGWSYPCPGRKGSAHGFLRGERPRPPGLHPRSPGGALARRPARHPPGSRPRRVPAAARLGHDRGLDRPTQRPTFLPSTGTGYGSPVRRRLSPRRRLPRRIEGRPSARRGRRPVPGHAR
ncbi:unnamed protein product, partial [Ectocarpus fasciculatus]